MSEDTAAKTDSLGQPYTEEQEMIIGAARILRKGITTRSETDALTRLEKRLAVADSRSAVIETMQGQIAALAAERDAASRELAGVRESLRAADQAGQELHELKASSAELLGKAAGIMAAYREWEQSKHTASAAKTALERIGVELQGWGLP